MICLLWLVIKFILKVLSTQGVQTFPKDASLYDLGEG